ncbi:MAG: valine--tRNA ligase [Thermoplasmata archaeon]
MNYEPKVIEGKWQDYWEKENIYRWNPERLKDTFSIDNPPRYASGALHLGHATHYTHIDIIARYKRMRGFNVFFPLCFDVNGMPIEVNVEKEKNVKMKDIDRKTFNKWCSEYAESKIGIMTNQFKILGESMDPSIYYQTDSDEYRKITQMTFLEMVEKGLVYRGMHPVNWCPRCSTAIAESEIEYVERDTNIYYIKFDLENGSHTTIATTRPELLPACLFLSYNPNDERYSEFNKTRAYVPLFNRKVPIIPDETVDPSFGTGIEMVCSIGDKNDLKLIKKHSFNIIKSIDEDGRLTDLAGKFSGMKIDEARKAIVQELKNEKRILKIEQIKQNVGTCWRCSTPIEIISKEQWFFNITGYKEKIKALAENEKWIPEFMRKRLYDWIDNLEWDWVISRQRYFATPIPAWICENGHIIYPDKEDILKLKRYIDPLIDKPPYERCPVCNSELHGSDEVFDTWVDSSISPLFNTFYLRNDDHFRDLYPMSLRPQAHDIIRTWAFYSIYRCGMLTDKTPWREVFIDGHILAEDGRPMHSHWGNVVDPLKIIEEYGTDAFRYFTSTCMPGEDTPFRKREIIHGRKLLNKIWNVYNFMEVYDIRNLGNPPSDIIDRWILSEFDIMIDEMTKYMEEYRFDRAIRVLENFFWHVFADQYIENIKYRIANDKGTKTTFYNVFYSILRAFSPFIPHITEEIYHRVFSRDEKMISIHLTRWPEKFNYNEIENGRRLVNLISRIRSWKIENNVDSIKEIKIETDKPDLFAENAEKIKNVLNIKNISLIKKGDVREKIISVKPDYKKLGPILKNDLNEFSEYLKNIDLNNIKEIIFRGQKIPREYLIIENASFLEDREVIYIKGESDGIIIIP